MASQKVAGVVVEAVARVLLARGFERKGRVFVRSELPAYMIVEVQVDRLRGMKLVLRLTSEVESRNRGWPINDPFKEGIEYSHSGPALMDPTDFEEWETVAEEEAAARLGTKWAQWLEVRGMAFLLKQAAEILERDRC